MALKEKKNRKVSPSKWISCCSLSVLFTCAFARSLTTCLTSIAQNGNDGEMIVTLALLPRRELPFQVSNFTPALFYNFLWVYSCCKKISTPYLQACRLPTFTFILYEQLHTLGHATFSAIYLVFFLLPEELSNNCPLFNKFVHCWSQLKLKK